MRRVYTYRNYEVAVTASELPAVIVAGSVMASSGFLATVAVRDPHSSLELPPETDGPFPSAAAALMAGFSTGQRLIDELGVRS